MKIDRLNLSLLSKEARALMLRDLETTDEADLSSTESFEATVQRRKIYHSLTEEMGDDAGDFIRQVDEERFSAREARASKALRG